MSVEKLQSAQATYLSGLAKTPEGDESKTDPKKIISEKIKVLTSAEIDENLIEALFVGTQMTAEEKQEVKTLLEKKKEFMSEKEAEFLANNPEPPNVDVRVGIALGPSPHDLWEQKRKAALDAAGKEYKDQYPEEAKKIDKLEKKVETQKNDFLNKKKAEFLATHPEPPEDSPYIMSIMGGDHARWEKEYVKFMQDAERTYYAMNPELKEIDEKYKEISDFGHKEKENFWTAISKFFKGFDSKIILDSPVIIN